jgi:hypothetical protein
MALKRVWLPCPVCKKPIALSLRKAAQFDFQVGCVECKTISHSADLLNAMKANGAEPHDSIDDRTWSTTRERAE